MAVSSRVNTPLPRVAVKEGQAFKELSGQTTKALAGNGSGVVAVPADENGTNYGRAWIRFEDGIDANGVTRYTPAIKAIATGDFYPADGMPIRVNLDPVSGLYQIVGNDVPAAATRGLNTNGLNPQNPSNNNYWFRQIRNMRSFPPSANSSSTTKISIEPYLYIYDGTVKLAQKGLTDNVDLSSYIPTAGNEVLVGIAIKASDNSVQIVQGTSRTISADKWTIADFQELYDLLDADAMPVDIYRLHNAQTAVTISDRLFDWRQFVNIPGGQSQAIASYENPLTYNATLNSGTETITHGTQTESSGVVRTTLGIWWDL